MPHRAYVMDLDKITTVSPSEDSTDAFAWDDVVSVATTSEAERLRETLFEAMRAG
jgi:hypothetical protein